MHGNAEPQRERGAVDLGQFALSDMVACGALVRERAAAASSMEEAADRIVRELYDVLRSADGIRNCVLVRCYKTHAFGDLEPELQAFARAMSLMGDVDAATPCLTLLASAGDEPAWNDRRQSRGHQAIPLQSEEILERSPMIAQLVRQLGVNPGALIQGGTDLQLHGDDKAYNVFYVADALGSPDIPAQEFVLDHGVRSVLGFGGLLPSGDLFSVILFSKTEIAAQTAGMFAPVALSVRVALLRFASGRIFTGGEPVADDQPRPGPSAIEQLLEVQDRIAHEQSAKMERAHAAERRRSEQLRMLARDSLAINSSLLPSEIVERATHSARTIIGADQAVGRLRSPGGDELPMALSLSERYQDHRDFSSAPDRCLVASLISSTGETFGSLTLADASAGTFSDDDGALLLQLAALTSISIENAWRYEREHSLALSLQHSMLPDVLVGRHRMSAAARYLPTTQGLSIGGDWYDVLHVSADEVALVIGDVVGHDLGAAKLMGRLRHAIAAFASEDHSPASVFRRVNNFVVSTGADEVFATACYLLLDLRSGILRSVNAGHPPVLIVRPGGRCEFLPEATAPPIGLLPDGLYEEGQTILAPGDMLLLYTDGLIERRGENLNTGLDRLRLAASEPCADAEALASRIELAAADGPRADDIAILVAQFFAE